MPKPAPAFYVFHGADEFTRAETLSDFKGRLGPPDTVDLNTTTLEAAVKIIEGTARSMGITIE